MRTLSVAASSVATAARIGLIFIATVLVTASIATSLARPSPRAYTPGGSGAVVDGASLPAEEPTQPPSPPPAEGYTREVLLWRSATSAWSKASEIPPGEVQGNDQIASLLRADGLEPGGSYLIRLQYGACHGVSERSFQRLASPMTASGLSLLISPGPGRERPDSTIPIPPDHAVASDGEAPFLALWGGTFSGPAVSGQGSATCPATSSLELWVRAQSDTLVLAFGGQLGGASGTSGIAPAIAYLSTFP